eukprot:1148766-Pelagomonas_calceolata.AAC.7
MRTCFSCIKAKPNTKRASLEHLYLEFCLEQVVKDNEVGALITGLEGRYVEPGPGGDPIRNPGVLPTGKNIHALDPQSIPTQVRLVAASEKGGDARALLQELSQLEEKQAKKAEHTKGPRCCLEERKRGGGAPAGARAPEQPGQLPGDHRPGAVGHRQHQDLRRVPGTGGSAWMNVMCQQQSRSSCEDILTTEAKNGTFQKAATFFSSSLLCAGCWKRMKRMDLVVVRPRSLCSTGMRRESWDGGKGC